MDFVTALKTCLLEKYVTFSGRARRSEYWFFYLFWLIVYIALSTVSEGLAGLFSLATLLPNISVGVRRLHDLDKSGWWLLLGIIPIIGWIVLIIWFCGRGTVGDNRFGPDPLA